MFALVVNRVLSRQAHPLYQKFVGSYDGTEGFKAFVVSNGTVAWPYEADEHKLLEGFKTRGGVVMDAAPETTIIGLSEVNAYRLVTEHLGVTPDYYAILEDDVFIEPGVIAWMFEQMKVHDVDHAGPFGYWDRRAHPDWVRKNGKPHFVVLAEEDRRKTLGFSDMRLYSKRFLESGKVFDERVMFGVDRDTVLKALKRKMNIGGADIPQKRTQGFCVTRQKFSHEDRMRLMKQSEMAMIENHPESAARISRWVRNWERGRYAEES
jgi:hypothetical protein